MSHDIGINETASLRARIAELEREKQYALDEWKKAAQFADVANKATTEALTQRDTLAKRIATLEESLLVARGRAVQELTVELQKVRNAQHIESHRADKAEAERDKLAEAAKELSKRWRDWNSTRMTPITCANELDAALAAYDAAQANKPVAAAPEPEPPTGPTPSAQECDLAEKWEELRKTDALHDAARAAYGQCAAELRTWLAQRDADAIVEQCAQVIDNEIVMCEMHQGRRSDYDNLHYLSLPCGIPSGDS